MSTIQSAKNLGIGARTAVFLREHYPRPRAKHIARQFNVSVATAERWLAGEPPTLAYVEKMVSVFGAPYLHAVFVEAFENNDERAKTLETRVSQALAVGAVAGATFGLFAATDGRRRPDLLESIKIHVSRLLDPLLSFAKQRYESIAVELEWATLIEGLVATVPAIPAPSQDTNSEHRE